MTLNRTNLALAAAAAGIALTLVAVPVATGGASTQAFTPPAGIPDLSRMGLQPSDLPKGAKVARQRYVSSNGFVAEYDREFKSETARIGSKRLLDLESDIMLAATPDRASQFVAWFHSLVRTKDARRAFAKQMAREAGVKAKNVTVGIPVNLHVGDESLGVAVKVATPLGAVRLIYGVHRTDRVVSVFYYVSEFESTITVASAKTLARPIARHVHDGLLPTPVAAPTIAGTAQVGQTLTASNGTWTNTPTTYTLQWQRCDATGASCVPIANATGPTYIAQAVDVGSTIRVVVTATNAIGSTSSTSLQTAVVLPGV